MVGRYIGEDKGRLMVKVGIVGGTGYTGVELLRLLAQHEQVEVVAITSRSETGRRVDDLYPNLRGHYDLAYSDPQLKQLANCDVVFFATPHNVAMNLVPELLAAGTRIVDLSADFRIRDADLWSTWYGEPHACPELLKSAVYGLPEVNRELIASAQLVACPGCYPTSVQLGFIPLLDNALVDTSIELHASPAKSIRGIHSTLYARLTGDAADLQALYESRYADEPFVDVLPAGQFPQTRTVKGANRCQISVCTPQDRDTVVVMTVIDNLVKGASGQAIQNMNIMMGLSESMGLGNVGLLP